VSELRREIVHRAHGLAFDARDQIARLEAGLVGRSAGQDALDADAVPWTAIVRPHSQVAGLDASRRRAIASYLGTLERLTNLRFGLLKGALRAGGRG